MDYEASRERIKDFLKSFYQEDQDDMKIFKYSDQISRVANRQEVNFFVDQDDVYLHDPELADWIGGNTLRYRSLFYEVIDDLVHDFLDGKNVRFLLSAKHLPEHLATDFGRS